MAIGFAQFVYHDMVWVKHDEEDHSHYVNVPACDPVFDPFCSGDKTLEFFPSVRGEDGGIINHMSSFIDGKFHSFLVSISVKF